MLGTGKSRRWEVQQLGNTFPTGKDNCRCPGGLAVYDPGLSSRVLGFESRPGRVTQVNGSDRSSPACRRQVPCSPNTVPVSPKAPVRELRENRVTLAVVKLYGRES